MPRRIQRVGPNERPQFATVLSLTFEPGLELNCGVGERCESARPEPFGSRCKRVPQGTLRFGSITELRNHIEQNSQCCARDLDREGIGERHFPETLEAAGGAGVTGVEVGAKGNQVVVRAQAP
jgi:hypothetical protein